MMIREAETSSLRAPGARRCYSKGMRAFRAASTALCIAALSAPLAAAAPAGPPKPPAESAPAFPALPAHALAYAPSPLDNPLKGFAPLYSPGKTYANKFPHSMEWSYFALNDLMKGPETFDWTLIEQMLDEVAGRGRQSVIRVYMEY